jgi:hypothetical protein
VTVQLLVLAHHKVKLKNEPETTDIFLIHHHRG